MPEHAEEHRSGITGRSAGWRPEGRGAVRRWQGLQLPSSTRGVSSRDTGGTPSAPIA